MAKKSILTLLSDVYGVKLRKGIDKLQIAHFSDVIDHIKLDIVGDKQRAASLFKVGLLHDVLEDTKITPTELYQLINIDKDELKMLIKLSRTHNPSADYITNIVDDENTLIVKLSDRISNMHDLLAWIKKGGVDKDNKHQSISYMKENDSLLSGVNSKYASFLKKTNSNIVHPFYYQYHTLKKLNNELKTMVNDDSLTEATKRVDRITHNDIVTAFKTITRIYNESDELQQIYPTFIKRITKTINYIEDVYQKQGISQIRLLASKIKFNKGRFLEDSHMNIKKEIVQKVKLLRNKKEDIPKDGIGKELAKRLHTESPEELQQLILSTDKGDLKRVYESIIAIYETDFKDLKRILSKAAGDGELTYRAAKYKELGRAITKYLGKKKKAAAKGHRFDFLDVDDVLAFRATFEDVGDSLDFMLDVTKKQSAYAVNNYLGTTKAYQGVNAKINYKGRVNYEIQSVIDIMQIVTDAQHDILFKPMHAIEARDRDMVKLVIRLSISMVLHKMIK